jgi:IS30 family transposase
MRGNAHVRCGERAGETDQEQSWNRAPARLSIIGKGNTSQIASLVERTTRFVLLVKIPYDRTAEGVAALLAKKMETLPEFLRNSVTWDQAKKCPGMRTSRLKQACPFISVTRTRPGNGAATRTPSGAE